MLVADCSGEVVTLFAWSKGTVATGECLQAICPEYIQDSLLGILAFDTPKLHPLMRFTWQAVYSTASDLEEDKW